jgi:diacylglycerol kinase family enzyme
MAGIDHPSARGLDRAKGYQPPQARLPDVEPLLLVANADAGGAGEDQVQAVLEVLRAGFDVRLSPTSDPDELRSVLAGSDATTVVVAGGDGSLHALVNALAGLGLLRRRTVGLVPLGTGNDFARGAAIPLDPGDAARVVLSGRTRAVDLVVDDAGTVVVNGVHLGVGAQASRAARGWKERLGRPGYLVGAALAGLRPENVHVEVTVDGEVLVEPDRPVAQVAIGNGVTVGGGTPLTPEAELTDGQVDVLVSFAVGMASRLGYIASLRFGKHHRRRDVEYVRGREITVAGDDFWVSTDGEVQGPVRRRTWRVEPGAMTMLLPPAARSHPPEG